MANLEVVNDIRGMLATNGWALRVKPYLLKLRDQAIMSLLAPSTSKQVPDDYTKGQVNALSWMIGWDARVEQFASEIDPEPVNPVPEGVGTVLGPDGAPTAPPNPYWTLRVNPYRALSWRIPSSCTPTSQLRATRRFL